LTEDGLHELHLPDPKHPAEPDMLHDRSNYELDRRLTQLLVDYFAGVTVNFNDVPIAPFAGTPFQLSVWEILRSIPRGRTLTYGEVAKRVGNPGASRAVGSAVGANPICIVIPCHRVLASGCKLGGFSSGLDWKRRLLRIERVEGWKE
jgi:methylated-DNA-[protein]-cysteine S-methyltransferase